MVYSMIPLKFYMGI